MFRGGPMRSHEVEDAACALCERMVPRRLITQHHLKPREKGGKAEHRVPLCKPCHKQLHATFSNGELARLFLTLESLRQAPQLAAFLKWIRKQKPDRNFRTVSSASHPHAKRNRLAQRRRWRS